MKFVLETDDNLTDTEIERFINDFKNRIRTDNRIVSFTSINSCIEEEMNNGSS